MENNIPDGCIAFDVEKALAGWPVVTRAGEEVKICLVSEFKGDDDPVKGWIKREDYWASGKWSLNGGYYHDNFAAERDLFLKKKTKTVWINIYGSVNKNIYVGTNQYKSEEDAKEYAKKYVTDRLVKTVSFELDDIEQPKTKTLWVAIHKRKINTYVWQIRETKDDLIKYMISCDVEEPEDKYWIKPVEVPCEEN